MTFQLSPIDVPHSAFGSRAERAVPISLSLLAHVALLAGLLIVWTTRPIVLPPPKPIDVQVLSEQDYKQAIAAPPAERAVAPLTAPQAPVTIRPLAPSTPNASPSTASQDPNPAPAMTHATKLFATALLKEPASRDVRATLPTLDRYERITQLCNIESTEQIRRAVKSSNPDTVSAAAFADTELAGLTMTARGAAYRSRRNWYALQFKCTVLPDLSGVADYSFSTGAAIPRDQWESHDLNVQDTEE